MLSLGLNKSENEPLRILCLGAHCDDIEIGCGGTILRLTREHPGAEVHWVVFSGSEERAREGRSSAERFLRWAGSSQIVMKDFKDGFFPYVGDQIKECFETLKQEFKPDLILTHCRRDQHQDHRTLADLTWNTFRDHFILEYEISKYEGDLGSPDVFVPLDEATCREKLALLMESFPSQRGRSWFDEETFWALLRLRGLESNAPSRYAEGFYGRKVVL